MKVITGSQSASLCSQGMVWYGLGTLKGIPGMISVIGMIGDL